ncbi:MAG: MASE1 domain-containing protein [Armatimonadota bacterium]|nr:MASE1 domain-containing protein [Armatimonadota bacterium]
MESELPEVEARRPAAVHWLLLWVVLTAAAYALSARVGLLLAMPPAFKATAVWAPSGIAIAALLLAGRSVWPGVLIGAFVGNVLDYFEPDNAFPLASHIGLSLGIAAASTLQALFALALILRFTGGDKLLERTRDIARFLALVPVACVVAPTLAIPTIVALGFAGWAAFPSTWLTWWLGDVVGIILMTPLILAWSKPDDTRWRTARILEGTAVLGLIWVVGSLSFAGWTSIQALAMAAAFLVIPLVVWGAFRFGWRGATVGPALFSVFAIWGTTTGHGPFFFQDRAESLLALQAFVAIVAITAHLLAAVLHERRREELAKDEAYAQLEHSLRDIRTLRGLIPICAWCKKIRNDGGGWEQLEAYIKRFSDADFSHSICPDCADSIQADLEPPYNPQT